ncbi:MAG: 30S ribosomal protein S17 [Candidatus Paceibacterota bacterium]|jgi:small subunit ribosomal protein S17
MPKKQLIGIIVSDKMQKTAVVKVETIKEHPLYRRRYKTHKKYKAHFENQGEYQIGDTVLIQETKPISKDKKWEIVEKVVK